ncbi:MAG: aminofutalosine synthase MqnE [Nitrospirota bacterium]
MSVEKIKNKIISSERLSREDVLELFLSDDIFSIGKMAQWVAEKKNGKFVYFIHNRHINPTNLCVNRCRLCAFSKDKGDPNAYTMSLEDIMEKARNSEKGITEFHIVGGLHPELSFDYYIQMLKMLKEEFPDIHIQAFTAVEIDYFSKISGLDVRDVLIKLKEAGLGSLPGGGAEIFDPSVRGAICEKKISGERWLEIMEIAHTLGLRSNATMLYGHIEDYGQRVDHLIKLRELQDKTGGFQSFIPLSFHPYGTEIKKSYLTTGIDDLKTLAISRLVLDNFDHIKAFWIMLGEKIAQVSLYFGVDDIDGTVVEEKITHAAGATRGEELTKEDLVDMIKRAGKIPVERDTIYNVIQVFD